MEKQSWYADAGFNDTKYNCADWWVNNSASDDFLLF